MQTHAAIDSCSPREMTRMNSQINTVANDESLLVEGGVVSRASLPVLRLLPPETSDFQPKAMEVWFR